MIASISPINQHNPAGQFSAIGTIQNVKQAIRQASLKTGVDFSYLLNKASQESSLDPNAKASGSTATGLFQFTQQTWLQMIKNHGAQYGLSQYADQITVDGNGVAHASDSNWRHTILALRRDPTVSAEMAGELDKQNLGALESDVGGKIGPTELYLAHFLGAGGATDFLNEMRANPNARAANILPEAAAANPSVFYDKSGAPRSVKQIYRQFAQKFDSTSAGSNAAPAMIASATPSFRAANVPDMAVQSADFASSGMNTNITPPPPSLYSAMVFAQMDMKDSAAAGFSNGNHGDAHKKHTMAIDLPVSIT